MLSYNGTKTGIEFYDSDRLIGKWFPSTDKVRSVDDLTKDQIVFIGAVLEDSSIMKKY